MAERQNTDDRRTTAELTDDFDLLPPEAAADDDVPTEVVTAAQVALAEEPNTCDDPRLFTDDSNRVALFTCRFNEMPDSGPDGELRGWLPAYRAQERFLKAFEAALPDNYRAEVKNNHALGIYSEGGR